MYFVLYEKVPGSVKMRYKLAQRALCILCTQSVPEEVRMDRNRMERKGEAEMSGHTWNIGDTIRCADADDAIFTVSELAKAGVDTDFLYERDGEKGLWVVVTGMDGDGRDK